MQSFVITLLTCSVTMSALALFYMAIMPLLAKRYSEKGRYYTWLIIIVGLIIPFRPQFNNAIVKVNVPGEAATTIVQVGNGTPVTMPTPFENAAFPSFMQSISWWQIAAAVWFAGVIVFLAYHLIKHCRFVTMERRWRESIVDEQALTLFQRLKTEMGISKRINLSLCSCAGTPMMIGFVNTRIILPKTDLAHDELHFILKHELVHYQRKDLWYKGLVLIAMAIHWFNPIVYLVAKAIDLQCELSCDSEVVRSTDADTRQHYSETLISVVKYQSKMKTALSTNFYGGKKGMKKRIFSIFDTSNKRAGVVIMCVVLIATIGTGCAFAANTAAINRAVADENLDSAVTQLSATNEGLANSKTPSQVYEYYTNYEYALYNTGANTSLIYEFYSYDEYVEYVDEEKAARQELLADTPEWPQINVDEVNMVLDETLKQLKNGTIAIVKNTFATDGIVNDMGTAGSVSAVGKIFTAIVVDKETGKTVYLGEFDTVKAAQEAVVSFDKGDN